MNFTIAARDVTITPDTGQSKVYGASDPALTFTNDGGLTASAFTGALSRAAGENAASYAITLRPPVGRVELRDQPFDSAGDLRYHQEGGVGDRGRQVEGVWVGLIRS